MAMRKSCPGHKIRVERKEKIKRLQESPVKSLDKFLRVLIKKGPVSEETSLKMLEDFANKPEWNVIVHGECSSSLWRNLG